MMAAIIFVSSTLALVQFALSYWRAMVASVAEEPVSDRIREAAGITDRQVSGGDFYNLLIVNDLSPDLRGPNGHFRAARAYYSGVKRLGSLIPSMAAWADSEMATLSRYVAVLMDQHLERNIACAAQMRGM